jgi:hypothetical protein
LCSCLNGISISARVSQESAASLASITLSPASAVSIAKGLTQAIQAKGKYNDGTTADITSTATWSTSDPTVAAISAGTLTGAGQGSATVTASLGSVSASLAVTVGPAVQVSLAVSPASAGILATKTLKMKVLAQMSDGTQQDLSKSATWNSTASSVASVNAGSVLAVSAGTTQIQATVGGQQANPAAITVPPYTAMALNGPSATLGNGLEEKLTARATLIGGTTSDYSSKVTWSSADPSIATVDATGNVIAVSIGTTTITATPSDLPTPLVSASASLGVIVCGSGSLPSVRPFTQVSVDPADLARPHHPTIHLFQPDGSPAPDYITPAAIRGAYGFDLITISGAVADGTGQTIAIVDAYDQPNIRSDLSAFDSQFGIPDPPSLTIVNETGGSDLPSADSGWGQEISADVEWAHAIAPGAAILLVEAATPSSGDLFAAVAYARRQPGVRAVSMSFSATEFSGETGCDGNFRSPASNPGVAFFAAAGDDGGNTATSKDGFPAASPNVVAVGGTSLTLSASGAYVSETSWNDGPGGGGAGGGGISVYEAMPGYQVGVDTKSGSMRGYPDVAYNGSNQVSPFYVYDSSGYSGWLAVGGTSLGTPQWAAFQALVAQAREAQGKQSLDGATQLLPLLYAPAARSDFRDITTGNNNLYNAGTGFDLVTGLGTPIANALAAYLAGSP